MRNKAIEAGGKMNKHLNFLIALCSTLLFILLSISAALIFKGVTLIELIWIVLVCTQTMLQLASLFLVKKLSLIRPCSKRLGGPEIDKPYNSSERI